MSGKTIVIIPTLNERENVEMLICTLHAQLDADILVIDDDSPDGTGEFVAKRAMVDRRIHCIRRVGKRGLGSAYRDGFQWALAHGYKCIVQMDADGSHDTSAVPIMVSGLETYDVVIGSRYINGGKIVSWPFTRLLVSFLGNFYINAILRIKNGSYHIHDSTSGFKAWRASALQAIQPQLLVSDGYAFQIETSWRAVDRSLSVKETPIVFRDRTRGKSKIIRSNIMQTFLLPWRLQRAPKNNR
ncbi:MAG: Undecaprenyl-phosphate mannosyltransferase [Syntrophorhabdus sp. PtaU1.Bin153]|nr:MAG: Undecaprenyl-phosphate mannosyltransferase [Syntrophorhabdus sp. PtaU1.Bin153]